MIPIKATGGHPAAKHPVGDRLLDWLIAKLISIDGTDISGLTIDGTSVSEVTIDGTTTWTAIPDSVVDDFEEHLYEDQNITLSDRYAGDLAPFTRQQTTVLQGSYALKVDAASTSVIQTTDFTVSSGNTYRVAMRSPSVSTNTAPYVIFGVPDETTYSGYTFGFNNSNDVINLYRIDSGSLTLLDNVNESIGTSTWYDFEFMWGSNGSLSVTAFNQSDTQIGSVSATDSTYTSGGIGWREYVGDPETPVYFDYLHTV